MSRKWIVISFCSLMVLSALFSSLRRPDPAPLSGGYADIPEPGISPRQLPVEGSNPARAFGSAIADAVEKVMPSVVVVRTEEVRVKFKQDVFGFIYRVPEQLAGEGSGVIVDKRGYIITSWHVVEGARQIEVVLNDGSKFPARCIGSDRATDLAVLKVSVEGREYPPVEFGDSEAVRVGEVAIAIGSPFSLQSSVTVGHVSQKGRRVRILPYEDFIQTDAAINEGNSGGPLIDVDGRLIGINTATKTDAQERGVGIAFSIPSNLAMVIAQSLIDKGKHEWPWVGAFFGTIQPNQRKFFSGGAGVAVPSVWDGTPAARAEIKPGDLVMEINGTPVKNNHDVDRIIYNHSVGDRLVFLLKRNKKEKLEIELLLEEYPGATP